MNCVFYHKLTNQYVVNQFGNASWTNKRDNATIYNVIERELLAYKLDIRPSDLIAETL